MLYLRIVIAMLFICLSSQAFAERRVALVIGNSAYEHVPELANPRNDAADMAAKLEGLGFEVVTGQDLDLAGLKDTVRTFFAKLDGADMALFFYAGHGLQVNGENYIAPVDAKLSTFYDLDFETVPMGLIMSAMERSTKVNLVFLDACRDNPLVGNLSRSMGTRSGSTGRGLAKLGSGVGSLIAFATQPGNVALDGTGRNSPFTKALLKHLGTPGRDVTRDLVHVRREVLDATGGKQVPWDNSSLTGEVILKALPKVEPVIVKEEVKPDNTVELAYWDTIKDLNDKAYFEAYLKQYPKGAFASIATTRIAILDRQALEEKRKAEEAAAVQAASKKAAEEQAREAALAAERTAAQQAERAAAEKAEQEVAALVQPPAEEITRQEGPDAADTEPDRELVRSIQKELNRVGCSAGAADGIWGNGSRRGLEQFARREKLELAALEPTSGILDRIKTEKARVCPLVCGRNQQEKNGRCIDIKREVNVPKAGSGGQTPVRKIQTETKKAATACPASALIAARQTLPRGSGNGGGFMAGTHACGRKFICNKVGIWSCSWR